MVRSIRGFFIAFRNALLQSRLQGAFVMALTALLLQARGRRHQKIQMNKGVSGFDMSTVGGV